MATAETDTIRLSTNKGLIGYTIKKFEAIGQDPSAVSGEAVLKLYSVKPTTETDTINFEDPTLLGCLFYEGHSANYYLNSTTVIFDNTTVNQDIFVTCISTDEVMNYYIELEQVKLAIDEAAVATLKDMRGTE